MRELFKPFDQAAALAQFSETVDPTPPDIKELARRFCQGFSLSEPSAPQAVANVFALALCRGDGYGRFITRVRGGSKGPTMPSACVSAMRELSRIWPQLDGPDAQAKALSIAEETTGFRAVSFPPPSSAGFRLLSA